MFGQDRDKDCIAALCVAVNQLRERVSLSDADYKALMLDSIQKAKLLHGAPVIKEMVKSLEDAMEKC